MAKILEMPKLSPTMEEGQLSVWHKKEGDTVAIDDLLAEVETDKATMEFRSFDKGTLLKLLVPAGSMVKLGQPVAVIGQPGEDISGLDTSGGGGETAPGDTAQASGQQPAQADDEGEQADGEQTDGRAAQEQPDQGKPAGDEQPPARPAAPKAAPAADRAAAGPTSSPSARGYGSAAQADIAAQARAQEKPPAQGGQPAAPAPKGDATSAAKGGQGEAPKGSPPGYGGSGQEQGAEQARKDTSRPAPAAPGGDERVKASPYVRKLAREHDLDLHGVSGSGPAGRVVARDVATLLEGGGAEASRPADQGKPGPADPGKPASKPAADPGKGEAGKGEGKPAARPAAGGLAEPEARPLSMMRKTIARRLTEAKQTVPHFYLTIDVDAGALSALREQINAELAQAARPGDEPAKVSLNDLLIKACAVALRRVPECNAQFTPEAILVHRRVDISVAVAVPEGLVTPVLRDADRLGLTAINSAVRDLATRAKARKLAPEEMQNGTFSISNLGMFGIDEFAAVINPPEGAILAVGRVRDEPVVRDGAVVAGKRLALTLSCDHRVIDGAVGARFLDALRGLIERPMQILVG